MARKPNAEPTGGGGGWAEHNRKQAERRKSLARTFGQDLMRGEHVVGSPAGVTFGSIEDMEGATVTGTSIFDPVLCELAYRWFCPPGGLILDPFAGGSVRGIVASKLGRQYCGIDLRAEQIEENRKQAEAICDADAQPLWITGDSSVVLDNLGAEADMLFSCPPYADLEVYSDNPADLSTMGYDDFRDVYSAIIAKAALQLKENRFACFVIGDVRGPDGFYRNLPGHTIEAFADAGLGLYNDAILVTAAGSLPIRAGKQFAATRKLGNTHQRILVFCKGDPRKATEAIGEVEFGEVEGVSELQGVEEL